MKRKKLNNKYCPHCGPRLKKKKKRTEQVHDTDDLVTVRESSPGGRELIPRPSADELESLKIEEALQTDQQLAWTLRRNTDRLASWATKRAKRIYANLPKYL